MLGALTLLATLAAVSSGSRQLQNQRNVRGKSHASLEPESSSLVANVTSEDPSLCLRERRGEKTACVEGLCADADGTCQTTPARRLGLQFRLSPASTNGAYLRAEVFPGVNSGLEPALRIVDGWKWEREDANWFVVVSPDRASVLLSTEASWPSDQSRRNGPVRVLDLEGKMGTPELLPLAAGGQAEWRLEDAGHDRLRLRHVRTNRYLHTPGVAGFWQALLQLWTGEPHLDSVVPRDEKARDRGTAFVLTPSSAVSELRSLGLVAAAPESLAAAPLGLKALADVKMMFKQALHQSTDFAERAMHPNFAIVHNQLMAHKGACMIAAVLLLVCLCCTCSGSRSATPERKASQAFSATAAIASPSRPAASAPCEAPAPVSRSNNYVRGARKTPPNNTWTY